MNMPLVLLNRRRRGGATAFSPSTLFALAEPGVWFDPSDLTTLFQDPAGTTPVTAPGNTVGLMLDKSKGLALGAELVANGDFSGGSTGWNLGAGVTVSGGKANMSAASGYVCFRGGVSGVAVGGYYEFTFTISDYVSGSIQAYVGSTPAFGPSVSANGTYTVRLGPIAGAEIGLRSLVAFTGSIDDISVKAVTGNHATQATLAARPTYSIEPVGGRRNLLVQTENFAPIDWTKTSLTVSGNQVSYAGGLGGVKECVQLVTVPGGTANKTLTAYVTVSGSGTFRLKNTHSAVLDNFSANITATSTPQTVTLTVTNGAGAGNGLQAIAIINSTTDAAFNLTVHQFQLELSATATPYQRVTTQHDVTEAGVASVGYLWLDGVSNSMVTSTITPGIDKAQVFTGVRKLSDAGFGIIAEFGPLVDSTNGTFAVGSSIGATARWASALRGTSLAYYEPATYASPITSVFTSLFDIGAAATATEILPRVNGSLVQTNPFGSTAGTGNFQAYPLYLGYRGGSGSTYFKGHLYSLITRFGPTLDAPTITSTEIWVAGKTGFYTPIITGVPTIGVS